MKKTLGTILLTGFLLTAGWAQGVYDGRIGEKEILTPEPAAAPRINGPRVYGVRPGRKVVYRIPCQGQRPIAFQVDGLPHGLEADLVNGIIRGTAPRRPGEYAMTLTARNRHGQSVRPFNLVVGEKIALTPPTGWNTWGGHMLYVSDALMRRAADLFVEKGLADVGFQYLSLDDCWMRISPEQHASFNENRRRKYAGFDYTGIIGPERDAEGNILPNTHFPDMKALADYLHARGLKAGLYSSPGRYTCQLFAGSRGHQEQDARQYARWGFDLLKYDLCSGGKDLQAIRRENPDYRQAEYWRPMAEYLRNQDRDILFNLCQYGREEPWSWAPALGIQSWRTGGDLNHHVEQYFQQALRLATELRAYSKPGQWNDPDFMYIHRIRDYRQMARPTREIPLDTNQRYQYVTLWSIICAPFFFSCNIDEIDAFTLGLLTNADVVNINQDELGHVAEVIRQRDDQVVMVKKLAGGDRAVALFNTDAEHEAVVSVDWEELDACCTMEVYDAWRQKELGWIKGTLAVRLSPNGVALFIVRQ